MDYLLKSSGLVIMLLVFYYLFLRNETFYQSIRIYFLAGLLIAVSLPLIEIPIYVEAVSKQVYYLNLTEINATEALTKQLDWLQITTVIYVIGVVIFSLKFLLQLISLAFLISKHQLVRNDQYYYIETSKNIAPFSFFNIIIYNKSHFTLEELTQIMRHEKAHAIQWHSVDTILSHLLVITLWFNPFVWFYKKAIQQNLEFLADANAIKEETNLTRYQFTLLKTNNTNYCTQITNNFYNSLIKKRITMLHKTKSANKKQWKYALIIPALIAFIALFNTKTIAQENEKWEVKTNSKIVALIIDKDYSDALLAQETTTFKNEFNIDLSFKGIKRNTANEITAIQIEAKGDHLKASFQNSGTNAIKPIKIVYNNENNAISIGNLSTEHNEISFQGNGENQNYVFISEDGNVNTWTSKSDTIINGDKIIINKNGNKEVIWVEKEIDTANAQVKIIKLNSDDSGDHMIFIQEGSENLNIPEDNASENVYIIKKDNGDIEKKVIKTKTVSTNSADKPLVFLDGKEISSEEMDKINPNDIESINVLKGESALKKYGEKGKNGVIEITKKK